jgi:hypothetical protein
MRDFSYASYFRIVDAWRERFSIHPLRDFASCADPRLYLRHDIDLCHNAAFELAKREAARGISSTYMFIPTSPLYEVTPEVLKPFVHLGHEVALHFDYLTSGIADPSRTQETSEAIDAQCSRLADMIGRPVESLSFHRPIPQFLHGPDHLFGRVNAYSVTLMACYRSDSRGEWRSDPLDIPEDASVAQLLTHPIWWGEEHQEPPARLRRLGADEELLRETVPGVAW